MHGSHEQWLETLAAVGTSLLSGGELHDVLSTVLRQAQEIVEADGAAVAVPVDEASATAAPDAMVVREAVGAERDRIAGAVLPATSSLLGRCLAGGVPIEVDGLGTDARVPSPHGLIESVGPAVCLPIGTPESVRGVLLVYNLVGRPSFEPQAVSMLDAFVRQVGVTLELAERRQDATRLALLEDRERIARDLHDVVIQRLFAIGLTLDGAGRCVADAGARRLMTRAVDELDQTIKEIRTTIFGLQAFGVPDYSSLRARVVGVVDQATPALGYVPSLRFEGLIDTKVPMWLSDHVVAVTREALSNVARHAHARMVEVKLSVTADDVTLLVEDDGVGIPRTGRRSGLRNMEARATAHGGRLALRPRDPSGTRLEWTVPLRPIAAASYP
jgi:signal transduction histidine kinase